MLRWRLVSDAFIGDEGWLVDEARICSRVPRRAEVRFDRELYGNGQSASVRLSDFDLTSAAEVAVQLSSQREPDGETALLTRVGEGMFRGEVKLERLTDPGDGDLGVRHNDQISAFYVDDDDGTGTPHTTQATARVDLKCPVLVENSATTTTSRAVHYRVKTDEPANIQLRIFNGGPEQVFQSEGLIDAYEPFDALAADLQPCSLHKTIVTATDEAGNVCTQIGPAPPSAFYTKDELELFADDVEPQAPSWTLQLDQGVFGWLIQDTPLAKSPTHTWFAAAESNVKDASLITPPVDIEPGDMLIFYHAYDLEADSPIAFDGGVLELSADGAHWTDIGSGFAFGSAYDMEISAQDDVWNELIELNNSRLQLRI